MPDSKITALTALTAADPAVDMFPVVDVSDTTMAASGTTKRISINNILACSPAATLASATITGAATVGTTFGVTGVSTFAAGTALLPALTTTGDTNTGIYYPAADTFAVTTAGTERYRVDSAGNFGIGVAPSAYNASWRALDIFSTLGLIGGSATSIVGHNLYIGAASALIYKTTNFASYYQQQNGIHSWLTAPSGTAGTTATFTQAMTLDASGNLLVGTTTSASSRIISSFLSSSGNLGIKLIDSQSNNTAVFANFSNGTGTLGTITNNNNAGVLYNTISDYRLKESVTPLSGGLARVNALKPSIYKWKSSGSSGEGFLAHELAEVVPFAVTGEKDAVNEDGSIKSQGIDMSRVVPILVAAIQELAAEVNALKNA